MAGLLNSSSQSPLDRGSAIRAPHEALNASTANDTSGSTTETRVTWSLSPGLQTNQAIHADKPWGGFLQQLQSKGQLSEQEAVTLRELILSRPATGHATSSPGTNSMREAVPNIVPGQMPLADRQSHLGYQEVRMGADRLQNLSQDHHGRGLTGSGYASIADRSSHLGYHEVRMETDRLRNSRLYHLGAGKPGSGRIGDGSDTAPGRDPSLLPRPPQSLDWHHTSGNHEVMTDANGRRDLQPEYQRAQGESSRSRSSNKRPHQDHQGAQPTRVSRPPADLQDDRADQDSVDSWYIPSYKGSKSGSSSSSSDSSSDSEYGSEEEKEERVLTFNDALKAINKVNKAYLTLRPDPRPKATAASEEFLRPSASQAPTKLPLVVEANLVATAMKAAAEAARGSTSDPKEGTIPECPEGLAEGKFLKPLPTLYIKGTPRPSVQHISLPTAALEPSRDDMGLVPPGHSHKFQTSISATGLAHTEEMLRRALEACSIMDAFLGAMFNALRTPGRKQFEVSPEVNSERVGVLGETACEALKSLTNSVARAHFNLNMAKRDSLLAKSNSVRAPHTRTALRTAPISSGSLFGGLVGPLIKKQAEANRDLAFILPQRPFQRQTQAPQKRPYTQPRAAPPAKRPRQMNTDKPRPAPYPQSKPPGAQARWQNKPFKRPAGQGRQAYRPNPQ